MTPGRTGQVRVPLADLRGEPRVEAELVNQALLGTPLTLDEAQQNAPAGWRHVRLPDYAGWMREDAITLGPIPPAAQGQVVVAVPQAPLQLLDAAGRPAGGSLTAYMGTILPLVAPATGEPAARVRLPGGATALAGAAALAPLPPATPPLAAAVIATARTLLGTPYLWGGMTCMGIDCSGLLQIAYRVHGVIIPRDADQQFAALAPVHGPEDWRPGDLIFFGHGPERVVHVMLYVGGERALHAKGGAQVLIQSLNPQHTDYHARPDTYLGARRVLAPAADEEQP